jgi:hypothetical protein
MVRTVERTEGMHISVPTAQGEHASPGSGGSLRVCYSSILVDHLPEDLPMPHSSLPISSPITPRARRRRAKHGIVAAYIHEISPRHRAEASAPSTPITASSPAPLLGAEAPVAPQRV